MFDNIKPDFQMATDYNGQSISAVNLKPGCIKSLANGLTIDTTDKTILAFEGDVTIQINGTGYSLNLPAYTAVCVADPEVTSIVVTGSGKYILI